MAHWTHWIDVAVSSLLLRFLQPGQEAVPRRQELNRYTAPHYLERPADLYRFADHAPTLQRQRTADLSWGRRERISFPSPYTPRPSGYEGRYQSYVENHTARGLLYRPHGPSQGAILYLHGWMGSSLRLEERFLFPAVVGKGGYTVLALILPFHGPRRPAASSFSGEFFVSADLSRTLEAFRQAVAEGRALLAWLRRSCEGPVGLAGLSLGSLVGSLLLGGGAQPDFAVLSLTPADAVGSLEQAPLLRYVRRDLEKAGVPAEDLREWSRLVDPAAMPLALSPQRLLLIHGRHDAIALPQGVRALREAWGQPEIAWYNGGHFSVIAHPRRILRRSQAFVEERALPRDERRTVG